MAALEAGFGEDLLSGDTFHEAFDNADRAVSSRMLVSLGHPVAGYLKYPLFAVLANVVMDSIWTYS